MLSERARSKFIEFLIDKLSNGELVAEFDESLGGTGISLDADSTDLDELQTIAADLANKLVDENEAPDDDDEGPSYYDQKEDLDRAGTSEDPRTAFDFSSAVAEELDNIDLGYGWADFEYLVNHFESISEEDLFSEISETAQFVGVKAEAPMSFTDEEWMDLPDDAIVVIP